MPMNPQTTYSFVAVTGAHTATPGEVSLVTTGAVAVAVTLPPIASCFSPVVVRKVDAGTGALSVVTNDLSTIDGVAGATGVTSAVQHAGWTFAPNGGAWQIVAS